MRWSNRISQRDFSGDGAPLNVEAARLKDASWMHQSLCAGVEEKDKYFSLIRSIEFGPGRRDIISGLYL